MTHIWGELVALVVFGLVFCAACVGLALQPRHPAAHRDAPTMDAVRLVMGVIATMAALVLSLLIATTYAHYKTQQEEVQKLAAGVVLIDAWLARYGPETQGIREALRADVVDALNAQTPDEGIGSLVVVANGIGGDRKGLFLELLALQPKTEAQRFIQTKAAERMMATASTRLMIHEEMTTPVVPLAHVVVMVVWLMLLFCGFGLYAPNNATVRVALGCGSLAVASALYLIIQMSQPYKGLIHVSDRPLRETLRVLATDISSADQPQHAEGAMIQSKQP